MCAKMKSRWRMSSYVLPSDFSVIFPTDAVDARCHVVIFWGQLWKPHFVCVAGQDILGPGLFQRHP